MVGLQGGSLKLRCLSGQLGSSLKKRYEKFEESTMDVVISKSGRFVFVQICKSGFFRYVNLALTYLSGQLPIPFQDLSQPPVRCYRASEPIRPKVRR